MEKLELKHLAPYLPYNLQLKCDAIFRPNRNEFPLIKKASATLTTDLLADINDGIFDTIGSFKPILRPLSDLTKEIYFEENNFIPFELLDWDKFMVEMILSGDMKIDNLSFCDVENLFKWHFDVFGLIEKGLAIDINTLNQ